MSTEAGARPAGRWTPRGLLARHRGVPPDERRAMLDELFYEGPELVPYLFRLAILMGLASVIAAL
ncbi:MAG TPA: hypothetical protein VJ986_13595, partial [Gaiellaceae bacterium]|nr:hypothetical protein [Gaiellaceae bacterium]